MISNNLCLAVMTLLGGNEQEQNNWKEVKRFNQKNLEITNGCRFIQNISAMFTLL